MHLFSRKEAPIGERPVMMMALSPGWSTIGSLAFTIPDMGTSVPLGIWAVLLVTSLRRVNPVSVRGFALLER